MPKKIVKGLVLSLTSFLFLSHNALAYSGDLSINNGQLRFSTSGFLEGNTTRIYATVTNNSSEKDLLGTVKFFANNQLIGSDQSISIYRGGTDDVFIDWTPSTFGRHKIAAKIYPWEDEVDAPNNNWISTFIYVEQDTDHDGISNQNDDDDDGDGVTDKDDHFPLDSEEHVDTDGDGMGDNTDPDDDNDGVPDQFDDVPLNPDETMDTDGDGIGNIADEDDDNDGIIDIEEHNSGTNPLLADTDNDGSIDSEDDFPHNPEEDTDTDQDGLGNNKDPDDDNDGYPDIEDEFPLNKAPQIKLRDELPNTFDYGFLEELSINAANSIDEDGEIVSYIWEINNQEIQEGQVLNYRFLQKGPQTIKLTVTDNFGESSSKEFQVNILNLRLKKQVFASLFTILLACTLFFKYIAKAQNPN